MFPALALSLLLSQNNAASNDYYQWCQRTSHAGTCIFGVRADSRINLRNTHSGLCTIFHDKAKVIATATASNINDLIKRATTRAAKMAPRYCADGHERTNLIWMDKTFPCLMIRLTKLCPLASEQFMMKLQTVKRHSKNQHIFHHLWRWRIIIQVVVEIAGQILNLNRCKQIAACY